MYLVTFQPEGTSCIKPIFKLELNNLQHNLLFNGVEEVVDFVTKFDKGVVQRFVQSLLMTINKDENYNGQYLKEHIQKHIEEVYG